MSMVIQHNAQAQLALGELNKNVTKVGKLLAKVSSGQKINSAQDDASSYVISEKMREQIRTLLQDDQNVQNGSSLFKIAEGGISNIVEELRNLKELAINSANDTNTDMDRLTIQKEFDQKKANINDIATTTNYNGKILLDGRYGRKLEDVYSKIWVTDYGTPGATTPINLTDNFYARTGTTEIEDSDFDSIVPGYDSLIEKYSARAFPGILHKDHRRHRFRRRQIPDDILQSAHPILIPHLSDF